jgi:hypothetical protein
MHRMLVHRQQAELDVVGIRDRTARPMFEDLPWREVFQKIPAFAPCGDVACQGFLLASARLCCPDLILASGQDGFWRSIEEV